MPSRILPPQAPSCHHDRRRADMAKGSKIPLFVCARPSITRRVGPAAFNRFRHLYSSIVGDTGRCCQSLPMSHVGQYQQDFEHRRQSVRINLLGPEPLRSRQPGKKGRWFRDGTIRRDWRYTPGSPLYRLAQKETPACPCDRPRCPRPTTSPRAQPDTFLAVCGWWRHFVRTLAHV